MVQQITFLVEDHSIGYFLIAPCAPRFLVVRLYGRGHVVVDHQPHVGLIDAHAESIGAYHHALQVHLPLFLLAAAAVMAQARMVKICRYIVVVEPQAQLLGRLSAVYIHDGAAGHLLQYLQQLAFFVSCFSHGQRQLRPQKTPLEGVGALQVQLLNDVFLHPWRSRSGKGYAGRIGQELLKRRYFQVRGPEIVAPLRDTVRLVYCQQVYLHLLRTRHKQLRLQSLRRHVEEFHLAVNAVIQGNVYFSL